MAVSTGLGWRIEPASGGEFTGPRSFGKASGRKVIGQHLRFGDPDVRELRLDHVGDLGVQLLPAALQQQVVGRVLHERVLESVDGVRRRATTEGQSGGGQLRERIIELGLRHRHNRGNQLVAKLASNCSSDLGNLLYRRKTIQPCHQRVPQRDGNVH